MSVGEGDLDAEVTGDAGGWKDSRRGNKVSWAVESPGEELFAHVLLERIYGKI